MRVNVMLVNVGKDDKSVFTLCQRHSEIIANLIRQLRRDLPWLEGLAQIDVCSLFHTSIVSALIFSFKYNGASRISINKRLSLNMGQSECGCARSIPPLPGPNAAYLIMEFSRTILSPQIVILNALYKAQLENQALRPELGHRLIRPAPGAFIQSNRFAVTAAIAVGKISPAPDIQVQGDTAS